MIELMILSVVLVTLFGLGYYLGNQFGRSAHIREDLRRARDANVIVRIQNQ